MQELIARETREEAGIEISPELQYLNNMAFIRPDGVPVVLIKFTALYKSGDVVLEEGAFTDHVWVNAQEVDQYDCINGVVEEVKKTVSLYATK